MCKDCGCEVATDLITQKLLGKTQPTRIISLGHSIVQKNINIAEQNRKWFFEHKTKVINLMSSPGSGKTLLLEKTIKKLKNDLKLSILVGDQQESFDSDRLTKAGGKVKQINTLSSCHLDASHISRELGHFVEDNTDLLIIENVGNLVCPAAFDLGESLRVAMLSVTEGEDKPSKYPLLFQEADCILINKMDLVPYLDWNQEMCEYHLRKNNPKAKVIYLSAKTGEGLDTWVDYLKLV